MERIENYSFGNEISRGAEGIVWEGFDTTCDPPRAVAIKQINLDSANQNAQSIKKKVEYELNFLKTVKSIHLAKLYKVIQTSSHLYIVYKRYHSDLKSYLNSGKFPSNFRLQKWANNMLKGLADLHFYGILHRDIKPANILLTDDSDQPDVIITDFGVSVYTTKGSVNEYMGTWEYAAPELIELGGKQCDKTDVYAYGLVLYELMSNGDRNRTAIREGIFKFRDGIDSRAQNFVKRCLVNDPRERPNTHQLAQDDYMKQFCDIAMNNDGTSTFINAQTVRLAQEKTEIEESIILIDYGEEIADNKEKDLQYKPMTREIALIPITAEQSGSSELQFYQEVYTYCYATKFPSLEYYVSWYHRDMISATLNSIFSNEQACSQETLSLARTVQDAVIKILNNPPQGINNPNFVKNYSLQLLIFIETQIFSIKLPKNTKKVLSSILEIPAWVTSNSIPEVASRAASLKEQLANSS